MKVPTFDSREARILSDAMKPFFPGNPDDRLEFYLGRIACEATMGGSEVHLYLPQFESEARKDAIIRKLGALGFQVCVLTRSRGTARLLVAW